MESWPSLDFPRASLTTASYTMEQSEETKNISGKKDCPGQVHIFCVFKCLVYIFQVS